ncbi:C1 family peptidase [Polycladomyces subterraneus]|uniref:C1 family peptidase n=1 Tax=Polycladomyces subterraneus TaxID=1016997 RepID=A0ABT8IKB2_9BACL|nr:C1 family peptidase [Polycladomyces subterraneus]MDN4593201.1 C1 family peptidase [Polycladomyces subterraneus]
MLRDGMKVLRKLGVCPENDFPYDIRRFTQNPSAKAEADVGKYKIVSYHRVRSLKEMKTCLHHGYPVAIGIKVYESFESPEVAETGVVPVLSPEFEEFLGGHACLVVGYDDEREHLNVRNSWGENWGDHGNCYLPYEFYRNGLIVDMWTAFAE